MAQLIGYTVVNGSKAKNYDYFANVNSQSDIERHRSKLKELNPNKTIYFTVRQKGTNFNC